MRKLRRSVNMDSRFQRIIAIGQVLRHFPKGCEFSERPRMSIFLRKIDSAFPAPVCSVWENAIVCREVAMTS